MNRNCKNYLRLLGNPEQLQEFADRFLIELETEPYLRFSQILPAPLFETNDQQINWMKENWGCPSDMFHDHYMFGSDCMHFWFETKERPPLSLIQNLSHILPELEIVIDFQDYNDNYEGYHRYQGGILQDDWFTGNFDYELNINEEEEEKEEQINYNQLQVQSLFQQPDLIGFHTCPICIKDTDILLETPDNLIALACDSRHIYCQACIDDYFNQSGDFRKCPLCSTRFIILPGV